MLDKLKLRQGPLTLGGTNRQAHLVDVVPGSKPDFRQLRGATMINTKTRATTIGGGD